MFSIIISEKGGAERREAYDKTEINVGRVQGNDLMLPKGNVSKRHARLLYRDGRFIVTDLKSTNGTYVNGRKIVQATIVREGDKIYIGDFVLRIESGAASASPSGQPAEDSAADHPSGDSHSSHPSQPAPEKVGARTNAPKVDAQPRQDVVSHFPLEQDPDDSMPQYGAVPGPPRMPTTPAARPKASGPPPMPAANTTAANPVPLQAPAESAGRPIAQVGRTTSPSVGVAPPPGPLASPIPASPAPERISAVPVSPSPQARRPAPPVSERAAEPNQIAAHRNALATLLERVADGVDLRGLAAGGPVDDATAARIERALAERIGAMKADGELPGEVDGDALVVEGRRELLELGPVGPMLDDEDVSEVQIFNHDFVVALHGRRQVPSDVAFSSEASLMRTLRRLCNGSGAPLGEGEPYVERRLSGGARMFALLPPAAAAGHIVLIKKPQRADLSLDDLVRSGTISRAMVGLLSQCVAARANILVTGALGSGTTSLLGALAAAGSTDDRVVVLQEDDEIIFNQPHTVSLLLGNARDDGARAVQAATRIHPDRLVVGAFAGQVAAEVVDAIGDGVDGVLAAARAPTLRQAAARLTADLAATRPSLTTETAREWLASAFDLAIEIARLRDGRHRVMRVSELGVEGGQVAVKDVFTFAVERTAAGGAVEGSFHATGLVPRIVEDLQARGVTVDTSIFKRGR